MLFDKNVNVGPILEPQQYNFSMRQSPLKKPVFTLSKLAFSLGITFLLLGSWLGAGCSLLPALNPGDPNTPSSTSSVEPSPVGQTTSPSENKPTASDTFPALEGQIQASYTFEYQCDPYQVSLPLYQSSYQYFLSQDKYFYYQGDLPEDWQDQFYNQFLSSENDLRAVKELIAEVSLAIDQEGDELVIALVSLVQNITYDCDKLFNFQQLEGAGLTTNFPYETLYTKTGVCGDTSLLLGKILQELGYGAAFLIYDQSNHMALGIQCPVDLATYQEDGKGYCYIETTSPSRMGVKPTNIAGREFVEEPMVIPFSEGISFDHMTTLAEEMEGDVIRYGQKILQLATCQEIQLYQEIRDREAAIQDYDSQLENLKVALENAKQAYQSELDLYQSMGCKWATPQCLAQQELVEEKYALYEAKVNQYNQVVEARNGEVYRQNLAIDQFNALMDADNQSCGVVFSEGIDLPEESE